MQKLLSILRSLLTSRDNQTFDVVRIVIAFGALGFITLAGYDIIIRHHAFDGVAYGGGFAALMGGGGAAIGLKAKDEPDA